MEADNWETSKKVKKSQDFKSSDSIGEVDSDILVTLRITSVA